MEKLGNGFGRHVSVNCQSKGGAHEPSDRRDVALKVVWQVLVEGGVSRCTRRGEQQRVAVARSLINSPLLIFADEPSGHLDSKNATELHQLFFQLRKDFNQTFVIVTHNQEFASMADRKLEIVDGVVAR